MTSIVLQQNIQHKKNWHQSSISITKKINLIDQEIEIYFDRFMVEHCNPLQLLINNLDVFSKDGLVFGAIEDQRTNPPQMSLDPQFPFDTSPLEQK
jgi:hypothetical protein